MLHADCRTVNIIHHLGEFRYLITEWFQLPVQYVNFTLILFYCFKTIITLCGMPLWGKLIYNTFQFKYMYKIVCVIGGGGIIIIFFLQTYLIHVYRYIQYRNIMYMYKHSFEMDDN